jgi:uncharacterized membrane protein
MVSGNIYVVILMVSYINFFYFFSISAFQVVVRKSTYTLHLVSPSLSLQA